MLIPCDEGTHWRTIRLYFLFAETFDVAAFRAALGEPWRGDEWLVRETGGPDCHSHVELTDLFEVPGEVVEADSGEEGTREGEKVFNLPRWMVQVDTTRRSLEKGITDGVVSGHEIVFDAVLRSAGLEQAVYSAMIDLYYNATNWSWRAPLFERPAKLEALSSELGRVDVAGLTLRFRGEQPGLFQARLEVSPDDSMFLVATAFSGGLDQLTDVYTEVLRQAESYARLFIEETE